MRNAKTADRFRSGGVLLAGVVARPIPGACGAPDGLRGPRRPPTVHTARFAIASCDRRRGRRLPLHGSSTTRRRPTSSRGRMPAAPRGGHPYARRRRAQDRERVLAVLGLDSPTPSGGRRIRPARPRHRPLGLLTTAASRATRGFPALRRAHAGRSRTTAAMRDSRRTPRPSRRCAAFLRAPRSHGLLVAEEGQDPAGSSGSRSARSRGSRRCARAGTERGGEIEIFLHPSLLGCTSKITAIGPPRFSVGGKKGFDRPER
jgi:hypothetical protein